LVNSRDIFLQIQILHCEFAEFLLHVGVFAQDLTFFHGICKIVFAVFTLHRDANNTFCLSFSGSNMMYLFNSTEWCYIKRTTDNVLQILLKASRWRKNDGKFFVKMLSPMGFPCICYLITPFIRMLDSNWLIAMIFSTNSGLAFNSTEWCYIKRTTDNVLQILLKASRWRVKTANAIVT
jgi:hypothetical protein